MTHLAQLKEKARPVWQLAVNLMFPPRCMACGTDVEAAHSFCAACFAQIRLISDPACALCGFPFEYDLGDEELCAHCMHDAPNYTAARAALHYDEHTRSLITRLKYADHSESVPAFAQQLRRAGAGLIAKSEVMLPVPLHPRRMRERKYNQSALLVHALADLCGLPVLADGLVRIRHTPPQASLSRAQRLKNVQTAFKVNHRHARTLQGKAVLLVDDVMTTGATIQACTKVLLGAGARAVYVLTLARTVRE